MKILAITCATLAALAVCGQAAAAPDISQAFGNTIQSTYPDGRQAEVYLQQGGAYQSIGRRGQHTSGTWRMRGNRLCLNQQQPFAGPFGYCTPIPESTNAEWSARAPTGENIRVRMVRGHVTGHKGQPRR
ncbi:MAG: hypothetical protein QM759_03690 [Terricaulis sp.]